MAAGVVEERGVVVGLLMPLIPRTSSARLTNDETGDRGSAPRELQWLIATPAQRDAAEIDLPDVDETDRLMLLAQLVYDDRPAAQAAAGYSAT